MQRDIIVGIPVSGRTRFEFDDVVGLFVNLLPAWNIADDTESFASFLNKVRDNCFYDFENQDFQFNDLLNELQKDSRIRLDDIIKTVFVYQKLENKNLNELNDTDTSGDENIYVNEDVKFLLTLGVNDYGNHLSFDFEFDSNKFSNEIIEEMIGNYIVICKLVVTDLNYTLSNIKESLNSTRGYESDIKTERIDADFEF
jgi:non-ribosomal peptide synthetase component F